MNAAQDDWTWTWTDLDVGALVWVGVMFFFILVGWAIGRTRGRGDAGAALGLLGPVGWIIAALLPEEGRRCPECRGVVPLEARRCKHCGVEFAAAGGGNPFAPETDAVRLRQLLDRRRDGTWYLLVEGKPTGGPFTLEELRALQRSGNVPAGAFCVRRGQDSKRPLAEVVSCC